MKGRNEEGREEARKVEMPEKDWSQQAVKRQVALAEQRERQQIGERWTEHRGPGGDEQGIVERIKPTEGMEKDQEEREGMKEATEGRGSCFLLMENSRKARKIQE